MARITQYQPLAQVGPKSASFKERTTPDKYLPNEPKTFVRPAIAAAALLATTTALAFVPPVNAAKTWVERAQADKVYVEIQRPVKRFDLTRAQYSYYETRGGLFFVPFGNGTAKTWAETTTPDKWYQRASEPRWDVSREQYLHPPYCGADRQQVPDLDSWWQQASEYLRQPDRRVLRNGDSQLTLTDAQTDELITVDKYWQQASEALRDVKRWQYLDPFYLAPDQQQVPDLDSWVPLANQPRFDLSRKQFSYPVGSLPDQQPLARLDSWHAPIAQPQFDLKRIQFLAGRAEWVSTFVANRVFPDSWHPESNKPQFDKQRNQNLYPSFVSAERQPQPRVDTWWQQPSEYLKQWDRRVQRVGDSEIQLTPTQDVERSSVDKYYPGIQQPQFDKKRTQFGFEFTFFYPLPFASPIFADSWHPLVNQPLFDRDRRVQRFGDSEIQLAANQQSERTSPDRWHPAVEKPHFDKRRQQGGYPAYLAPERQADVRLDSWWQRSTELIPSHERRLQAFENGGLPFTPRAIFVDSWYQQTNERIQSAEARRYLAEFFVTGTTEAERTTIDRYDPGTQRPQFDIARLQYLAPLFFGPDRQPEPRLDAWHAAIEQPRFDTVRSQHVDPSLVTSERQPSVRLEWSVQASDPIRNRRRSPQVLDSFVPFTLESVTLDKWQVVVGEPRRSTIWLYGLSGFFAPDLQSVARLDSWYVQPAAPQRLSSLPAPRGSFGPIASDSETSTFVDQWHPEPTQPLFDLERIQYGYLVASFHPYPFPDRIGSVKVASSSASIVVESESLGSITPSTRSGTVTLRIEPKP